MQESGFYILPGSQDICEIFFPEDDRLKIFLFISLINNFVFMTIFYIFIVSYLYERRKEVYGSEIASYMAMVKSVSRTVALLVSVYVICLVPSFAFYLKQWPPSSEVVLYLLFNPVYFWINAVNVFIYLLTNKRIREAYRTFLKDVKEKIFSRTNVEREETTTETSAFWIQLRKL